MLDFLRSLAPRQAHALRPAAPLRASASAMSDAGLGADALHPDAEADALLLQAPATDALATHAPRFPEDGIDTPRSVSDAERGQPRHARGMRAAAGEARISGRSVATAALPPDNGTPSALPLVSQVPASPLSVSAMRSDASLPSAHLHRIDPGANPDHARHGAALAVPGAPLSAATVAMVAPDAAVSAPPAIHISIDRIDVRTAPAPAHPAQPQPRPRPAVEPQSLQDYLRRKPSP